MPGGLARLEFLRPKRLAAAAAIVALAVASVLAVPELPGGLVAYGRFMPVRSPGVDIIYQGEGLTATIAVSRQANGILTYHNAGKAQASTYPQDMRLQRMLGHLTTLVPENGKSYLVIGLGAGVTAGAVSVDPNAERVVIADIEPLTRRAAGDYFREQNFGVIGNPKVEFRVDDGRHFLLTTDEKFDGITSDPLDPWVKGAAALYTREFWELVRSKLNPGGVVTVFVQLYETTEDGVRSELATFFDVFPNGAVFANTIQGQGYDVVLLAQADDAKIDADRIHALLERPEYGVVAGSLAEVGFRTATDLLGTYAGRASDLAPWLEDAAITTDRNLRLQYLAGLGLNLYRAEAIFSEMSSVGPIAAGDYFEASPARMGELERIIRAGQGRF
jgi:spermidine synthase